jgi:hypothetical protein
VPGRSGSAAPGDRSPGSEDQRRADGAHVEHVGADFHPSLVTYWVTGRPQLHGRVRGRDFVVALSTGTGLLVGGRLGARWYSTHPRVEARECVHKHN